MRMTMRNSNGEAGAVAVIVAITSVLLMSVGALAVDIGNGYARKRDSQKTADLAALAGAAHLGKTDGVRLARIAAIDYVRDKNPTASDDGTTVPACAVASATSPTCWDNDGDENNGEITFTDDAGTATTGIGATRIRVVSPRRTVSFGLGAVMGFNEVTVQKAATAGIFSPGGASTPPFYLTPTDVGMTCIKDDSSGGGPKPQVLRASLTIPQAAGNDPAPTAIAITPNTPAIYELTALNFNITGSHLNKVTSVTFRNNATTTLYTITPVSSSNGSVTGTTGTTMPAGTYTVQVLEGATAYGATPPLTVTLQPKPAAPPPPTFSGISPTNGPELSTGAFTLTGTGLKGTGATTVAFGGGGSATNVVVNAAGTSLTGNLPPLAVGEYTLVVTNSNGTATNPSVKYTANALPKPTSLLLVPDLGPSNGGTSVVITGVNLPTNPTVNSVTINGVPVQSISGTSGTTLTVVTPPGAVGPASVIVYNGSTASDPATFTYTKDAIACQAQSSNRGYIDEPRYDVNGSGPALITNIKKGLDHNLHTWQMYKLPAGAGPRDATTYKLNHTECDGMPAGTIFKSGSSSPVADINCLRLSSGSKSSFESGFFDTGDGRMYQKDTGAATGTIGGHANVDMDDLFDARFVDAANLTAFKASIIAGIPPTAAQRGWLKDAILKCPRFGILPVTTAGDPPPNGSSYFPIVDFMGMFITSVPEDTGYNHGFDFQGGSMRSVKGFVFPLSWLNANISSSSVTATQAYIGTGPVVVKLVRDIGDGNY